jgi:hypothetical protein
MGRDFMQGLEGDQMMQVRVMSTRRTIWRRSIRGIVKVVEGNVAIVLAVGTSYSAERFCWFDPLISLFNSNSFGQL